MSDLFSHFTSIAFAPYQRLGDKTTRDWGRRVETRCSFISDARHGLIDLRVQFRGGTGRVTRHFTIRLFGASRGSCAPTPTHYLRSSSFAAGSGFWASAFSTHSDATTPFQVRILFNFGTIF